VDINTNAEDCRADLGFCKGRYPIYVNALTGRGLGGGCPGKFLYYIKMMSFYAFPEIFIDTVPVKANRYERKLTLACFEHIFFSKRAP